MPRASAGPFSKSEFVQGTRYGLYGYVLPNTVLHPVEATMPMPSGPYVCRVAATSMRIAVASPQPEHEPAPPTKPVASPPPPTPEPAVSSRPPRGGGGARG